MLVFARGGCSQATGFSFPANFTAADFDFRTMTEHDFVERECLVFRTGCVPMPIGGKLEAIAEDATAQAIAATSATAKRRMATSNLSDAIASRTSGGRTARR